MFVESGERSTFAFEWVDCAVWGVGRGWFGGVILVLHSVLLVEAGGNREQPGDIHYLQDTLFTVPHDVEDGGYIWFPNLVDEGDLREFNVRHGRDLGSSERPDRSTGTWWSLALLIPDPGDHPLGSLRPIGFTIQPVSANVLVCQVLAYYSRAAPYYGPLPLRVIDRFAPLGEEAGVIGSTPNC